MSNRQGLRYEASLSHASGRRSTRGDAASAPGSPHQPSCCTSPGALPVRADPPHPPHPPGSERVTWGAWPPAAARPTGVPRTTYGRLLPAPDERPGPLPEIRPHSRRGPGSGLWRRARSSSKAAAMVPRAAPARWGSGRPNGQVLRASSLCACAGLKGRCSWRRLRGPNLQVSARLAAKPRVSAGCAARTPAARSPRLPVEAGFG